MSIQTTPVAVGPGRQAIGAHLAMTALALAVAGTFLLRQAGHESSPAAVPALAVAAAPAGGADPLAREVDALVAPYPDVAAPIADRLARELDALTAASLGVMAQAMDTTDSAPARAGRVSVGTSLS